MIDWSSLDPATFGYLGWSFPAWAAGSPSAINSGIVHGARIALPPGAKLISVLSIGLPTAGVGLTAGECFAGLYDNAGNLLSVSADQSTAWETTANLLAIALDPVARNWPWVYAALLSNGGTAPKVTGAQNCPIVNGLADSAHQLFVQTAGGLTSMPAQLGQGAGVQSPIWAAVS